jgi:hypothetical protein
MKRVLLSNVGKRRGTVRLRGKSHEACARAGMNPREIDPQPNLVFRF